MRTEFSDDFFAGVLRVNDRSIRHLKIVLDLGVYGFLQIYVYFQI